MKTPALFHSSLIKVLGSGCDADRLLCHRRRAAAGKDFHRLLFADSHRRRAFKGCLGRGGCRPARSEEWSRGHHDDEVGLLGRENHQGTRRALSYVREPVGSGDGPLCVAYLEGRARCQRQFDRALHRQGPLLAGR